MPKARKSQKDTQSAASPAKVADMEQLVGAVQDAVEQVRTKTVDFSFNELFDMYRNDELQISPEYQRLFRWGQDKRSQFIESLVLELPIPPIYVVEEEEGRYELIDGLQRFSSYLHLRGELRNPAGELEQPLVMDGCDIVEELNGLTYDELPTALQIRLKRMSVPVQVLRKESDRRLRYHMFKRLNTGGEPLSAQEVRNATIRLLGTRFNDFIREMAQDPNYQSCVSIMTEEAKDRMTREECVLRFFAFKNDFENYTKLITPFLDSYMEKVSDETKGVEFDYAAEEEVFRYTFAVFANSTAERSFSTVIKGGTLGNQFSMAHFDVLTQGIQSKLDRLVEVSAEKGEQLAAALIELKTDSRFRQGTAGGGKNYQSAYRKNIAYVESWISKWLATA